jgi:hypothetical protein
MKRGDMAQIDYDAAADREMRRTVAIGGGIILLMSMSLFVGVFFGWLIWGI